MKNALLIGGGGTLGLYTAQELLKLGYRVDDICLEKMQSDHPALRFICAQADDALLRALDRAGVELRCAFFVAFSDPRTLLIQLPGGHQTHVTVKCHD